MLYSRQHVGESYLQPMLVQLLVCFVNLVCNACDDRVSQQLAALLRLALACLHTRRRVADDKDVLQHCKPDLATFV